MKIPLAPVVILGGAALTQVGAAPSGLIESIQGDATEVHILPFRLGHAAGLARPSTLLADVQPPSPRIRKHGCGTRMRAKAMERMRELSNRFRAALGLPLIKEDGELTTISVHFHNSTQVIRPLATHRFDHDGPRRVEPVIITSYRPIEIQQGSRPFLDRLQHSLDMLGTWESMALSFVLGCGIGVLLRMLFVFAVLARRSINYIKRDAEHGEDEATFIEESEVIFVAPPAYTDEKVEIPSEVKPVAHATTPEPVPTPNWEGMVKNIDTVEETPDGLVVYWTRVDGTELVTPASTFSQACPQRLISFYQSNLKWKHGEE